MLPFQAPPPEWLDQSIQREVVQWFEQASHGGKGQTTLSASTRRFLLSASQFADRLVLDRKSAEYLVSIWHQFDGINQLDMKCEIHPSAVPILVHFFRDKKHRQAYNSSGSPSCAVQTLSIVANFLADGDFVDGTSLIDCISEALDGNISVQAFHCDYYSFRYPRNATALRRLLTAKRNLIKLVFNSCDFGSGSVSFLAEGLAAQQCLEEIRMITPEELEDAQTSHLIEALNNHCHQIRRICWCHLGNQSFRALSRLIGRSGCRLEWVRVDGQGLFEDSETVEAFKQALYQNGTLQRFTFVGEAQDYPRGLRRYVLQCNRRNQYVVALQEKGKHKLFNSCRCLFSIAKLAKGSIIAAASPIYLIVRTALSQQLMEHSSAARKRPRAA